MITRLFKLFSGVLLVVWLVLGKTTDENNNTCDSSLLELLGGDGELLLRRDDSNVLIHQNADGEACSPTVSLEWSRMIQVLDEMDEGCRNIYTHPNAFTKFHVESFLTRLLASAPCSTEEERTKTKKENLLLRDYCDMGPERTVIQLDHDKLIPVPDGDSGSSSLPCRFYTREGVRIASLAQFYELLRRSKEYAAPTCAPGQEDNNQCRGGESESSLHLYAVPAGRVFMFPALYVGEVFDLSHVDSRSSLAGDEYAQIRRPVSVEVLSMSPRVFEINNFFSKAEAQDLVQKAKQEESETHRLKRSTTGTDSVFSKRTSENAWDTHGETSGRIKRRCLTTLGFDTYEEGLTDGLQILRYNLTAAYIPHMDYMTDNGGMYDYNTAGTGGNRFATVLLYMSDLEPEDGGETVFSQAYDPHEAPEDHVDLKDSIQQLRASGDAEGVLEHGSWQEEMVAQCRSRLRVRPRMARSILFYSQLPDGREDKMSKHGGCPTLHHEKWAANLWVWSAPRGEFPGSPMKKKYRDEGKTWEDQNPHPSSIQATFRNLGQNPRFKDAELFYEDTFWSKLGFGDKPQGVNTFVGHKWNIKVNGVTVKRIVIGKEHGKKDDHEVFDI